MVILRTDHWKI